MALPLVGLASGLSTFFSTVIASAVGVFASFASKKVATAFALGSFLVGGWIALQLAIAAAWAGLGFVVPGSLQVPLSIVASLLPSNLSPCLSALVLAKIGRWLWDNQREWGKAVASS